MAIALRKRKQGHPRCNLPTDLFKSPHQLHPRRARVKTSRLGQRIVFHLRKISALKKLIQKTSRISWVHPSWLRFNVVVRIFDLSRSTVCESWNYLCLVKSNVADRFILSSWYKEKSWKRSLKLKMNRSEVILLRNKRTVKKISRCDAQRFQPRQSDLAFAHDWPFSAWL